MACVDVYSPRITRQKRQHRTIYDYTEDPNGKYLIVESSSDEDFDSDEEESESLKSRISFSQSHSPTSRISSVQEEEEEEEDDYDDDQEEEPRVPQSEWDKLLQLRKQYGL